ncbi:MAG: phosphodiester glycosidase family protein [Bacillota bacterium]
MIEGLLKQGKRKLALAVAAVMTISAITYSGGFFAEELPLSGLGQILHTESFMISSNLQLSKYIANHPVQGIERAYALELKPGGKTKVIAASDKLYGGQTLSNFINANSDTNQTVIGGINGDFYDTITGVPIGPVISKGQLLASCNDGYPAIGFFEDGSAFIDSLTFRFSGSVNNGQSTIELNHLNKNLSQYGIYMFTDAFSGSTKTSKASYDVICEIIEGAFSVGGQLKARVIEIKDDAVNTEIGIGNLILSAEKGNKNDGYVEKLKTLKVGDELLISSVVSNENAGKWHNIKEAVGGGQIIIKNGSITTNDSSVHPRTAIGIKADGSVVMLAVDGRQPEHSHGLSLVDTAAYLLQLGCTDAINMDGGGSTTIAARMPGHNEASIMNRPSDGRVRANPNALLLVSPVYETGALAYLHNYPAKVLMLPGAQLTINAMGTDANYQPVAVENPPTWQVAGNIGKIENGVFTAGGPASGGYVISQSGNITGKTEIELVKDVQVNLNCGAIYLDPGMTFDFAAIAKKNMLPVVSQDSNFSWTVEGNIGTIDEKGLFKAANVYGLNGRVVVSFGDSKAAAEISVGRLPVILADFENGVGGWVSKGDRLPSGGVKIYSENREDFVRFGSKSMKLRYNMVGGTAGTAGVYAEKPIKIEGYPSHIGMWVYGDGKGHWLRAQLRDGKNETFYINLTNEAAGVDWVGWRYVEAAVPAGKTLPLTLDRAIRYMETNEDKKSSGTIYIDNIRAVYGYKNDDLNAPRIARITPLSNTTLKKDTDIKIKVSDSKDKTDTGIDPSRIKLFVDDIAVSEVAYYEKDGTIKWKASNLADGKHKFLLKVKDNFGNVTEKTWYYKWDTGKASLYSEKINHRLLYTGGEYRYLIKVKNADKELSKLDISLTYNPDVIEIIDQNPTKKLTQVMPGEVLNGAEVKINSVRLGKIRVKAENIAASSSSGTVIEIAFRIKSNAQGKANIQLQSCLINDKTCYIDPINIKVDSKYSIAVAGTDHGMGSTITVTDKAGKAVEGASLLVNNKELEERTDKNGEIYTYLLTDYPVGTILNIQAVKDGFYSSSASVVITESKAAAEPMSINMALLGADGMEIGINWLNNIDAENGILQLAKSNRSKVFDSQSTRVSASTQLLETLYNNELTTVKAFSAKLTGLEPGTRYMYRVGGENSKWSRVYEFTTASKELDDGFSFLYITDPQGASRSDYDKLTATLKKIGDIGIDTSFTAITGDLVDTGSNGDQWKYFFESMGDLAAEKPIVPVIGNHELSKGDSMGLNFINNFTLPENGPDGLKETCYSFDYGNTHFAVLNSQISLDDQVEWLEKDMQTSTKKWKIVMLHRGPYPSFYDGRGIKSKFTAVFDKLDVDLVLSGHDHVYSRAIMENGKKTSLGKGTVYVNGGSSGVKYYDGQKKDYHAVVYDEDKQVFSFVDIGAEELKFTAYNIDGKTVDSFTIKK